MNYEQAYQWLHGNNRVEYSGCRAAAEAMEEELRSLKKDAERYRHLREYGDLGCTTKDGYGGYTLEMGEKLDSAVDFQIAVVRNA